MLAMLAMPRIPFGVENGSLPSFYWVFRSVARTAVGRRDDCTMLEMLFRIPTRSMMSLPEMPNDVEINWPLPSFFYWVFRWKGLVARLIQIFMMLGMLNRDSTNAEHRLNVGSSE